MPREHYVVWPAHVSDERQCLLWLEDGRLAEPAPDEEVEISDLNL
jgi:hypothetical protein